MLHRKAPEGQRLTCLTICSAGAPSKWIQGITDVLNTDESSFAQHSALMHFFGSKVTVKPPLENLCIVVSIGLDLRGYCKFGLLTSIKIIK